MPSNPYHDLVRARVQAAIQAARAASSVGHAGLKGRLREILVRDVLKPLLPADLGVGTGVVVDYYGGHQSREQDIVLYDRAILPPVLFAEAVGLFPIESVLYTIEVKSTLSSAELRSTHESARDLHAFAYLPGKYDLAGNRQHHSVEKARSVLIAFDSDLGATRRTEVERYHEVRGNDEPFLRALCVIGRGYWYDAGNGAWPKNPGTYEGAELVGMLSGIMNTYRWVAMSRGFPALGNYVHNEDAV